MSITKEQWTEIEQQLKADYGQCDFRLDGKEIQVRRERYKEGRTCLVVYIDRKWCAAYSRPEHALYMPITTKIWHQRKMAFYSPKRKAELIKVFRSAKRARELFPDLDKVAVYHEPIFFKASTLVRQYRRIRDIELICIGYSPSNAA